MLIVLSVLSPKGTNHTAVPCCFGDILVRSFFHFHLYSLSSHYDNLLFKMKLTKLYLKYLHFSLLHEMGLSIACQ